MFCIVVTRLHYAVISIHLYDNVTTFKSKYLSYEGGKVLCVECNTHYVDTVTLLYYADKSLHFTSIHLIYFCIDVTVFSSLCIFCNIICLRDFFIVSCCSDYESVIQMTILFAWELEFHYCVDIQLKKIVCE